MIKAKWIQSFGNDPTKLPGRRIVQSWDTAMKPGVGNDYSVCLTFVEQGGKSHLVDIVRERVDYPDLKRLVTAQCAKHRPDTVLIEDKGSGISLIAELKAAGMQGVIGVVPEGDKESRMLVQSAKIEAGDVFLPHDASWLAEFLGEILAFPSGRHDDQIDALSQYLKWIGEKLSGTSFAYDMGWGDGERIPDPDTIRSTLALPRRY